MRPLLVAPRPRSVNRGSRRRLAAFLVLGLLATAEAQAGRYAKGETVVVTGRVTDAEGRPLPGVEVALSGHRRDFDVWSFKMDHRGQSEVTALSDDKGSFSIEWRWDPFYNRFRLAAGIRQKIAGEEKWWEVVSSDLTRAMKRGSPVVANLMVENAEEVRTLQAFVDDLESVDAQRVYQELGKPDKVRKTQLPRHEEVTWWYFDRGMMYRFVDGRLDSSESFDPVAADEPPSARSENGAPGA